MSQKGLAPIVIILLIAGVVLFTPLPRYQHETCNEMYPPTCYPAGWKLSSSLWDELTGKNTQTVSYTPSFPSPTDETADWKMYTDELKRYQIQVPSSWNLLAREATNDSPMRVSFNKQLSVEEEKDQLYVILAIDVTTTEENIKYNLETSTSNQAQFKEWLAKPPSNGADEREFKIGNVKVNNKDAVQLVNRPLSGDPIGTFYNVVTWVHKDGINYKISLLSRNKEVSQKQSSIYNQILSTFKFTD